jgi:cobalt-zinc-cadmium efflux system outer membrane protein
MRKRRNLNLSLSYLHCAIAVSLSVAAFQFSAASEKTEAPPVDTNSMDEDLNTQFTAPTATLGLQATFDTANSHNKQLIAARYNLPIAKAAITIAGAIPNPRFNLQYGFGPAFKLILAGNPQQFGWQEQIRTAGKRTKQLNVARANYTLAEFNLAAALFDVHNRVRRAYSELAAAEAYAALIAAEKKVAGELVNIAQKRYDNGKAAQSELLQAQLAASQLDTQAFQAQTRLQTASSLLAQMLGQTPKAISLIDVTDNGLFKLSAAKTEIVPSVEQNLPKLADLLPTGYSDRPDLKVAIQQAFSDRRALSLARAQRIPDLFIDSGYQFTTFTPVHT